jgi:hypothetical protein
MSAAGMWIDDASRPGRSWVVDSIVIPTVRPSVEASAWNRVPRPIGPGESFSARRMRGLYRGSLRLSATESTTSWTGR